MRSPVALRLFSVCGALICAVHAQPPSHQKEVTGGQVVAALEGAYGVHAGQRRNHAKGTCASGTFAGAADIARYSRSALFSGDPLQVVARFSLAGGARVHAIRKRARGEWPWSSGCQTAACST